MTKSMVLEAMRMALDQPHLRRSDAASRVSQVVSLSDLATDVSAELLTLAKRAVQKRRQMTDAEVEAWAARLAADVADLND